MFPGGSKWFVQIISVRFLAHQCTNPQGAKFTSTSLLLPFLPFYWYIILANDGTHLWPRSWIRWTTALNRYCVYCNGGNDVKRCWGHMTMNRRCISAFAFLFHELLTGCCKCNKCSIPILQRYQPIHPYWCNRRHCRKSTYGIWPNRPCLLPVPCSLRQVAST